MKDTLRNVEETGEFVCNFVGFELREKMNAKATEKGAHGKVVFWQVVGVHIRDEVIVNGMVDFRKLPPIARMG